MAALSRARLRHLRRVLAAKVRQHPELRDPLDWPTLLAVAHREEVDVLARPLTVPAKLVRFAGRYAIVVNANEHPRRHTYRAAHELGHLWLHVDDAEGRDTQSFNFSDFASPDAREDEAELVAAWLLGDESVRRYL
jgi:Zn-dependent peptidase ImmA (M78 family)